MEIEIAGHCVPTCFAALSMKPKEYDAIIITNPNWPFPEYVKEMAKDYLHMEFLDINDTDHPECPKEEHVKEMLEWAEGKDKLLVCCHAGISRSSATALLIAAREWGLNEAFRVLTPGWHAPNRLILWLGSRLLEQPVDLAYQKWRMKAGY